MKHTYFTSHFQQYILSFFIFMMVFFSFQTGASASDRCPSSKDHSLAAEKYKMFTAYQTAYDGYQVTCEIKCFNKETCIHQCQKEKAVDSLKQYFSKAMNDKGLKKCDSLSRVCLDECHSDSKSCSEACSS